MGHNENFESRKLIVVFFNVVVAGKLAIELGLLVSVLAETMTSEDKCKAEC